MNWQVEFAAKLPGEFGGLAGARAGIAAHVHGMADNDLSDAMARDERAQMFKNRALVLAFQSVQALGGDAKLISDGQSDAPGTKIESQNAFRAMFLHPNDYRQYQGTSGTIGLTR